MKHAEFKKHLSNRLAIQESEIKTLLRANRKILKKLVNKDNGFSIPTLGLFKKHPVFKHKEYSHYHGYELLTKLKKILRFYPESFTEKKVSRKAITHSDISDLLTNSTGVSSMLSQQFLNETATIIKEGLARDNQVFVSGVGLFKMNQRKNNDTVKELKNDDKIIYFKADAGLRNNIFKSNNRVLRQYSPTSLEAESSLLASNKTPMSTIHNPIVNFSGKATDNYQPPSTIENQENKLTRETFLQENKGLYLQEKHPYFEWAVIAIFLIILASGLYLIKPSVEPANEFSSVPFEFTEITKTNIQPASKTIEPAEPVKKPDTLPGEPLN